MKTLHSSVKALTASLLLSAALLPLSAQAQMTMPPDGTVPISLGTLDLTHDPLGGTYGTYQSAIMMEAKITMDEPLGTAPYTEEYLEISAPNSAPKMIDIAGCPRSSNRIINCPISYQFSPADTANPSIPVLARYYVSKPGFTGYLKDSRMVFGQATGGTQVCNAENNPMLPTQTGAGQFTFTIPAGDVCPTSFWIDPPIAGGYTYTVAGAKFESVTMPGLQTVNDTSGYLLEFPPSNFGPGVFLDAGETHTFTYPVDNFAIKGINPSLALDPNDGAAFATGVNLTAPTGQVTITQTAILQNYPGTGPQPAGCNAWTQEALQYAIKAQLPNYPATIYDLRVLVDTPVQQALLADLAAVRAWRPDTREINLKVHVGYAGNGADPVPTGLSNASHPGVGTMTSTFRSDTHFMVANTWTGNKFNTNHWYRVNSKINVMDYDNEWISPWDDDCLYQTAFVRVDPMGSIDIRFFDNLSGTTNRVTAPMNGSATVTANPVIARPVTDTAPPVKARPTLSWPARLFRNPDVEKAKQEEKPEPAESR